MALNFLKFLDADDIFISYSREDGSAYLTGLDVALSKGGFSCFTDKRGTDAGKLPPETLYRKIRACKTFVLLATPGALKEPENIAPEVAEFAKANGTSRIVSVSFDQDEEFHEWDNTPWYEHVEGKAREREHPNTLKTGEPSEKVVEQIVAVSNYMKSKDRLRRYRNSALSVLGVLVIAIIAAAIVAGLMMKKAKAATDNATAAQQLADDATAAAEKSLSQALTAQMEAGMAQLGAEIAKADATEQKKVAETAAAQAREAKARAMQQQTIAKVRSLANSSQTLLRQRPQEIQRSMSRAVEAMQLSDSIDMHILEADTALRDNVTLFARLKDSAKHDQGTVLALSPDGKHFVKKLSQDKVGIYAVGSDTLLKELACPPDRVAISSGLKYVVAAVDGGLKIFDLNDESKSRLLTNTEARSVDKIAMSPTGWYVAFTKLTGQGYLTESTLQVFETTDGNEIALFNTLETHINDVAYDVYGNLGVAGSYIDSERGKFTGRVYLWLVSDGTFADPSLNRSNFPEPKTYTFENEVNAVAPGGLDLFATDQGIWRREPNLGLMEEVTPSFKHVAVTPPSDSSVKHIAFSASGTTLTLVRAKDALEVWDTLGEKELVKVVNDTAISSIGFKPDGQFIAMPPKPGDDLSLVFGALDGKPGDSILYGPDSEDGQIIYQSRDNSFVVSAKEKVAVVWDVWGKKKQTATFDSTLGAVRAAALSKRGDFLVLSDSEYFIVYHSDGNSFKEQKRFKNPYDARELADKMSLSADGGKLAVIHGYADYVMVWDILGRPNEITPEILRFQKGQKSKGFERAHGIKLIALSPSGLFLVAADEEKQSWIIDLSAGRTARMDTLLNDTQIESMGFSADDRYLGLGSDEGVLHIFDVKTSEGTTEIATLQHEGRITNVVFSDDNKYVATVSTNRPVVELYPAAYGANEEKYSYPIRIWLLQPRELLKVARARLKSINHQ